jgi:hypothetical protein
LLYHHPSLSPSSGGMSASAMITSSSSGIISSQLPTATTMQPPYTIGMTQSILFSYSLMIYPSTISSSLKSSFFIKPLFSFH